MKSKVHFCTLFVVLFLVGVFSLFPSHALATDNATLPAVTDEDVSLDNIPPPDEISANPNYSEGIAFSRTTVGGGCSITKISYSSVNISGYTTCTPASPSVEIMLKLQAYYSGAWHTLATKAKAVSGTYVSLSQSYYVTPGYYYRTYAIHSTADGTTAYSQTNGIWVG